MVWQYKPWWCQPWSIILTGITVITGSWWVLHSFILTGFVSVAIAVWWVYFLIIYPRAMAEAIANMEKDVSVNSKQ